MTLARRNIPLTSWSEEPAARNWQQAVEGHLADHPYLYKEVFVWLQDDEDAGVFELTLARTPASGWPVDVFLRGLLLTDRADYDEAAHPTGIDSYEIAGTTIAIRSYKLPQASQAVTVRYRSYAI